jgi:hypothetical protein
MGEMVTSNRPSRPDVRLRRAAAALAANVLVLATGVVAWLIGVLIIGFSSLPPGCGFNSSDACTDPGANATTANVLIGLYSLFLLVFAVIVIVAITDRVVGGERRRLGRLGIGFSAALVLVGGVAPILTLFFLSDHVRPALFAEALLALAWPVALVGVAKTWGSRLPPTSPREG